jgi:hypothetical protein
MDDTDKVYPMKRATILLMTLLALTLPRFAHAQFTLDNDSGPPPYNDVEDGQALRLAGYILAPFGYALEWTVMRPMHYAATDTAATPMLSGDADIKYFGQTSNADRLPSNTFAPFVMPANPNAIVSDTASAAAASGATASADYHSRTNILPPVPRSEGYRALPPAPGGQPALH